MVNLFLLTALLQVARYCASVVIIISNILTDGKHLVPMLSHGRHIFVSNLSNFLNNYFLPSSFRLVLLQLSCLSIVSDLPFLEGLFDVLPVVPDDDQARYALWCTLPRILPQPQETEMNSSALDQFASLFLGKFTLIKDDLESHVVDKDNLSSEDALVMGWTSKCVSF
jgi:hypothetical protein